MSKVLRVCRLAKYCVLVVHVAGCAAFCILGSCLRLCTSCGHFEAVDDQVVLAGATTCSSGGGHWAGPHAHLGEFFSFDRVAVEQSDKKKPHLMFTVFQKFVKRGRCCSAMPSRRGAVRDSRWEATFLWFSNWSRLSRHCA